jgi:hypothetical protein
MFDANIFDSNIFDTGEGRGNEWKRRRIAFLASRGRGV